MTDMTIWKVLFLVVFAVCLYARLGRRLRREAAAKRVEDSGWDMGWDMFCDDHFIEALDYITDKYPEHGVGFCKAARDAEFDDDESMRCGYPDCTKESTHEIHWIKFEEAKKE